MIRVHGVLELITDAEGFFVPSLRLRIVRPKLREARGEALFLPGGGAAEEAWIEMWLQNHLDLAAQYEVGRSAVISSSNDDLSRFVFTDRGVRLEDLAQRHAGGEGLFIHAGEWLDGHEAIDIRVGHVGIERVVPAIRLCGFAGELCQ